MKFMDIGTKLSLLESKFVEIHFNHLEVHFLLTLGLGWFWRLGWFEIIFKSFRKLQCQMSKTLDTSK
jgi:hypothetical protein